MTFTKPATADEMYATLQQIFYFYRIKKEPYSGVTLEPLQIERLSFVSLTDEQLTGKADLLTAAKNEEYLLEKKSELSGKISAAEDKLAAYPTEKAAIKKSINSRYDASEKRIKLDAVKKGIAESNAVLNKLTELEAKRNAELKGADDDYAALTAKTNEKITALTSELNGLADSTAALFEKRKQEKFAELKDAQDKTARDVKKYNNALDEKEQRYDNYIAQTNASLQLRYMELRSEGFTKDQLIDMGYYQDAINCVCAYYDTLEALAAARAIAKDSKICVYLDDFYEDIVYMYQTRAN